MSSCRCNSGGGRVVIGTLSFLRTWCRKNEPEKPNPENKQCPVTPPTPPTLSRARGWGMLAGSCRSEHCSGKTGRLCLFLSKRTLTIFIEWLLAVLASLPESTSLIIHLNDCVFQIGSVWGVLTRKGTIRRDNI